MPKPPTIAPSKGALQYLRNALLYASFGAVAAGAVALTIEQRRQICLLQKNVDNGKKLNAFKHYLRRIHAAAALAPQKELDKYEYAKLTVDLPEELAYIKSLAPATNHPLSMSSIDREYRKIERMKRREQSTALPSAQSRPSREMKKDHNHQEPSIFTNTTHTSASRRPVDQLVENKGTKQTDAALVQPVTERKLQQEPQEVKILPNPLPDDPHSLGRRHRLTHQRITSKLLSCVGSFPISSEASDSTQPSTLSVDQTALDIPTESHVINNDLRHVHTESLVDIHTSKMDRRDLHTERNNTERILLEIIRNLQKGQMETAHWIFHSWYRQDGLECNSDTTAPLSPSIRSVRSRDRAPNSISFTTFELNTFELSTLQSIFAHEDIQNVIAFFIRTTERRDLATHLLHPIATTLITIAALRRLTDSVRSVFDWLTARTFHPGVQVTAYLKPLFHSISNCMHHLRVDVLLDAVDLGVAVRRELHLTGLFQELSSGISDKDWTQQVLLRSKKYLNSKGLIRSFKLFLPAIQFRSSCETDASVLEFARHLSDVALKIRKLTVAEALAAWSKVDSTSHLHCLANLVKLYSLTDGEVSRNAILRIYEQNPGLHEYSEDISSIFQQTSASSSFPIDAATTATQSAKAAFLVIKALEHGLGTVDSMLSKDECRGLLNVPLEDGRPASHVILSKYGETHDSTALRAFVLMLRRKHGLVLSQAAFDRIIKAHVRDSDMSGLAEWLEFWRWEDPQLKFNNYSISNMFTQYSLSHKPDHYVIASFLLLLYELSPTFISTKLLISAQHSLGYHLRAGISGRHGCKLVLSLICEWNSFISHIRRMSTAGASQPVGSRRTTAVMTAFSQNMLREAVNIFRDSILSGKRLKLRALETAVEASTRSKEGYLHEARYLIKIAERAGMDIDKVKSSLIIHRMYRRALVQEMEPDKLCEEVRSYYRRTQDLNLEPEHYMAITVANKLSLRDDINAKHVAVNLLRSIYESQYKEEILANQQFMLTWMKVYARIYNYEGVRWIVQTVLDNNMRISNNFSVWLRSIRAGIMTSENEGPNSWKAAGLTTQEMRTDVQALVSACDDVRGKHERDVGKLADEMSRIIHEYAEITRDPAIHTRYSPQAYRRVESRLIRKYPLDGAQAYRRVKTLVIRKHNRPPAYRRVRLRLIRKYDRPQAYRRAKMRLIRKNDCPQAYRRVEPRLIRKCPLDSAQAYKPVEMRLIRRFPLDSTQACRRVKMRLIRKHARPQAYRRVERRLIRKHHVDSAQAYKRVETRQIRKYDCPQAYRRVGMRLRCRRYSY
ncbi:hypothetical protein M501DRAFT_1001238 [Patellaria atrata CBS 101060]|uniref:Uncharacterized protein n=1 Tax=Patellaria atrata CBS 101060 TaxID=1346257 RepID=A0A9P4S3G0_9PEZI|nr:hypothetical protein M501DRAFT_1001238 [Patellaria atrata CBS 101060]